MPTLSTRYHNVLKRDFCTIRQLIKQNSCSLDEITNSFSQKFAIKWRRLKNIELNCNSSYVKFVARFLSTASSRIDFFDRRWQTIFWSCRLHQFPFFEIQIFHFSSMSQHFFIANFNDFCSTCSCKAQSWWLRGKSWRWNFFSLS